MILWWCLGYSMAHKPVLHYKPVSWISRPKKSDNCSQSAVFIHDFTVIALVSSHVTPPSKDSSSWCVLSCPYASSHAENSVKRTYNLHGWQLGMVLYSELCMTYNITSPVYHSWDWPAALEAGELARGVVCVCVWGGCTAKDWWSWGPYPGTRPL